MTSSETDLGISAAVAGTKTSSGRPSRPKKRRQSTFWRVREDIPKPLERALIVTSILAPLLIWTLVDASGLVNPIAIASPFQTARAGYDMAVDGTLAGDTLISVQRIYIAYAISLLISVPLGLAIGSFPSIRALFEPAIGLVRYVPATAFTLLLIFWLGVDEGPKLTLIILGTVFFNTLMTANVVWQVPTELINVSRTLGAGSGSVFRKVIFPHAVPGIIDTARVNLAAAWNLVVVAEIIAADSGLGMRIVREQKFLHVDSVFVCIVVIGVLGLTSDIILRTLRNRLAPWSQE